MMSAPEAGWYADPMPGVVGQQRWWDGTTWTGQVRAEPVAAVSEGYSPFGAFVAQAEAAPAPPMVLGPNPWGKRAFVWGVVAMLFNVLAIPGALALGFSRRARRWADANGTDDGREYAAAAKVLGIIAFVLIGLTILLAGVCVAIAIPVFVAQQQKAQAAASATEIANAQLSLTAELVAEGAQAVDSIACTSPVEREFSCTAVVNGNQPITALGRADANGIIAWQFSQ